MGSSTGLQADPRRHQPRASICCCSGCAQPGEPCTAGRRASVALTGHCDAYEFVGGVFAKGVGGIRCGATVGGVLAVCRVAWRAARGWSWVTPACGSSKDFALDPAQDLIVLLRVGNRHPAGPITANGSSFPDAAAGANVCVHLQRLSVCQTESSGRRAWAHDTDRRGRHGDVISVALSWGSHRGLDKRCSPSRPMFSTSPKTSARTHLGPFRSFHGGHTRQRRRRNPDLQFREPSSPRRPVYVATLHLPLSHDYRVLLELTTTTGPFITSPPAGVIFAARNARAHVFTLHHGTAAHRGRWHGIRRGS